MIMEKLKDKNLYEPKCSDCPSGTPYSTDNCNGEVVCHGCGVVIGEVMDRSQDWRAYTKEEKEQKARAGPPPSNTIHDKGMTTIVGWDNKDGMGKYLGKKQKKQAYVLRKWQTRSRVQSSLERNLSQANQIIVGGVDRLGGIPKPILDQICLTYRKAVKKNLVRGRSIISVAAAATRVVLRENNIPRTLREVSIAFNHPDEKDIFRSYRVLLKEMKINVQPPKNSKHVSKLCNDLESDVCVETFANSILGAARKKRQLAGKGPDGLASAAVYIAGKATGNYRTQKDISYAANVTEVTVRNRYKHLLEHVKCLHMWLDENGIFSKSKQND